MPDVDQDAIARFQAGEDTHNPEACLDSTQSSESMLYRHTKTGKIYRAPGDEQIELTL